MDGDVTQDQPAESGKTVRILIVEDDALVALGVQYTLEELGYQVCGIARSQDEALAMAAQSRPTFALMDIRIQGSRDGIDTARRLFEDFGIRSLYLSAYADHQTMSRIGATRSLGFVQKPYSAT